MHAYLRGVVLSDVTLRELIDAGRLLVDPYDPRMIQPASIDMRLDHRFRIFTNHRYDAIDPKRPMDDLTELLEIDRSGEEAFVLHPREFALAATVETVTLPDDLVGRFDGKSSLGRLGLITHQTAGFIDPGFSGQITLELSNAATLPIRLYPGMKIGQLSLMRMDRPVENPYGSGAAGSKYHGQQGPTPSEYWRNFEDDDRT